MKKTIYLIIGVLVIIFFLLVINASYLRNYVFACRPIASFDDYKRCRKGAVLQIETCRGLKTEADCKSNPTCVPQYHPAEGYYVGCEWAGW